MQTLASQFKIQFGLCGCWTTHMEQFA